MKMTISLFLNQKYPLRRNLLLTYHLFCLPTMTQKLASGQHYTSEQVSNSTLQIGRCGSLMLTSRFSHFRSKCTMFFPCKYSIPNAESMAINNLFLLSIVLQKKSYRHVRLCLRKLSENHPSRTVASGDKSSYKRR